MKITSKRLFILTLSYFFVLSGYAMAGDKYKTVSFDRELKHKAEITEESKPVGQNKMKAAAMAIIAIQPERSATAVWLDEQDEKKRLAEQAQQNAERIAADLRDEISKAAGVVSELLKKYTKFEDPSRLPLASIKKIIEKEIPADYGRIIRLYELDTYNPDQKILGNFESIEKVEKAIAKYSQKLLTIYNENDRTKRSGKFLKLDFVRPLTPTEIDVKKIKADALELVKKFSPKEMNYPETEYGPEYEQQCDAYEKEETEAFSKLRKLGIESTRNRALREFINQQYDLLKDIYQKNRVCYFHKRIQALEDYYENWLNSLSQDEHFPALSDDDARYYRKITKELETMLSFNSNQCAPGAIEKFKSHVMDALAKIKNYFEKIVEANNTRYDSAMLVRSIKQDPSLENYLKLRDALGKALNLAKSFKNKKFIEDVVHDIELVEKRIKNFEETPQSQKGALNQANQPSTMPSLTKSVPMQVPSNDSLAALTLPPVQNSSVKPTSQPKKPTHLAVPVRGRVATPRDQRSPSSNSKKRSLPPVSKEN